MSGKNSEHVSRLEELGGGDFWLDAKYSLFRSRIPRGGKRVLDIGCGTGRLAAQIASMGNEVVGMDSDNGAAIYAPKEFKKVRPPGKARFVRADATRAGRIFPAGSFDVIILSDVLEHVPDDSGLIGACARLLRKGGVLLVSVPAHAWLWGPHDLACGHVRRYSARELRMKLGAEFREVRIRNWNFAMLPVSFLYAHILKRDYPHSAVSKSRLAGPLRAYYSGVESGMPFPIGLSLFAEAIR